MCLSREPRLLNFPLKRIVEVPPSRLVPQTCTYLAVPAQRQVFGIVDDLVVLVFALALAGLLFVVLFALLARPRLLPLDVLVRQLPLLLRDQSVICVRLRARVLRNVRVVHIMQKLYSRGDFPTIISMQGKQSFY